jgi:hypothetical protein
VAPPSRLALAGSEQQTTQEQRSESTDGTELSSGVIGHTNRGNYGHQLDLAFQTFPNIELTAVARRERIGDINALASSFIHEKCDKSFGFIGEQAITQCELTQSPDTSVIFNRERAIQIKGWGLWKA